MTPFLKQIAVHYYDSLKADAGKVLFIFPNRRSIAFFRKWLAESEKNDPLAVPLVMPGMLTMNDFFSRVSGTSAADKVSLLLELYGCYRKLNRNAEPLDDFIFWGDVILSDFDDTDKYLADPRRLYTNVADFKEIQDSYSYLTENQLEAIRHFIGHFRKGGKLTVNIESGEPGVKERFLMIWNLLYPLYEDFNKSLRSKNMAYEGMVYRSFAERLKTESAADILSSVFRETEKYVFVGLNALNECEKVTMRKMRDAGIAEFCWDYSSDMIRDRMNRSSMFMSENVREFPQAFEMDADMTDFRPDIRVMSVPSSVGQVKQIPEILKEIAAMSTEGNLSEVGKLDIAGADTAIIIPDETLLIPLLNTVPPEIDDVNVTMGYPVSASGIHGLMGSISALQLHLRKRGDGYSFYHKQVWSIFSSGIIKAIMDDEARETVVRVKEEAKYYIPQEDLTRGWPFNVIFRPVITDPASADAGQIRALETYQLSVLNEIGAKISGMDEMTLETQFAKKYYLTVNRLSAVSLDVLPLTYVRILQQLVGIISVPFRGEPLKGLQIMGPLETRSLDFTNLIVLSCNEGVFPHRNVSSSFIPPELRKGFGLPTYENQDAVWAYYFFRMIQRASNVWMLYDSRTEGLKSGEESRYIKQLEYQYRYPKMSRTVLRYRIGTQKNQDEIPKTAEDLERIRTMTYSASSLQNYLACPARFYYSSVCRLEPENGVEESMDNGMIGSVFHDTMFALYTGGDALLPDFDMDRENVREKIPEPLKEISADYIKSLLDPKDGRIRSKVRALVRKVLNSDEVSGRNLVIEDVLNQYVAKTLEKDLELICAGGAGSFRILGLEMRREWKFGDWKFVGYIDRMDSFRPGTVRIVDYKTGKVEENDVRIDASNAVSVAESLFGTDVKDRPKIALQLFLYDMYVAEEVKNMSVENVLYPVPKLFSDDLLSSPECPEFNEQVLSRLDGLFRSISDPGTGFRRTADSKVCAYCDFRKICGR